MSYDTNIVSSLTKTTEKIARGQLNAQKYSKHNGNLNLECENYCCLFQHIRSDTLNPFEWGKTSWEELLLIKYL